MRVALTGAGGFVGSALQAALAAAGHQVQPMGLRKDFDVSAVAHADALVHLAAIAHRRGVSPHELRCVNVELAARVADAAAARGTRMIFMSSAKVHGEAGTFSEASPLNPRGVYAHSKAGAEEALQAVRGLRLTVLRPPLVYGPGVKANFFALTAALARGLPLPFASVSNRRSLVYVGNLADAVARCLASPQSEGRTYLIADGAPVSTPELCRALGRALRRPARLFSFPPTLLPSRLADSLEVDDAAIRRELGWRPPFSFEEGLRATADWYLGR